MPSQILLNSVSKFNKLKDHRTNLSYISIVKLLVALSFILLPFAGSAQGWPQIDSVELIPSAPTEADETIAVCHSTMGSCCLSFGSSGYVDGFNIYLQSCHLSWGYTAITEYADTVNLGYLPEGSYTIYYTVYGSMNDTICDYTDTSDLYTKAATVRPHPYADLYGLVELERRAYPNPVYDVLNLRGTKEDADCRIFSADGKLILKKKIKNQIVDLSELPMGTYFIETIDKDLNPWREKILKR